VNTLLRGRDLITLAEWSVQEIRTVLDVALEMKRRYALGQYEELLKHKTLFMLFFEQSTRTRNSLEAGMTQLGGHAHDLTPNKMQLSHGESPQDTAKVLSRMGDAISIRNCFYDIGNDYLRAIAEHAEVPVISMQDDLYHPLQGLADLMTIEEYFGANLKGLKVAVSWAYATTHAKPLSVPVSQALLFPRFGMDVVVANPPEFPLQDSMLARAGKLAEAGGGSVTVVDSMDDAVAGADVVIPKNWGGFSHFDTFVDDEDHARIMKENLEKHKDWICTSERFAAANKGAKIMHALPADRGNEITDELLDSDASIIYDEAENRLHTSKSLLALLMGGRP
jgi:ornithine carbamoyltransferase